jgi:hypothetical protein
MNEQHHVMVLDKQYPTGEEDWYCPTCGRRFIVNWEPKFKRTILETGDEYAVHSGGKGGLQLGSMQITPVNDSIAEEEPAPAVEDPRLAPWAEWLDESGFEDLWDDGIQ